jgi:hypothetical protein
LIFSQRLDISQLYSAINHPPTLANFTGPFTLSACHLRALGYSGLIWAFAICMFAVIMKDASMEHSLFLRQYKYEIPGAPASNMGLPVKPDAGQPKHEPAFLIFFDFENGGFQLEGDYRFIGNTNTRVKDSWLNQQTNRIFIEADMKPEIPAGPNDNLTHELILSLKGSIYNGRQQCKCFGLLRLNRNAQNMAQWMIYCNLVDNDMDIFEIKLMLPVFTSLMQTPGDN